MEVSDITLICKDTTGEWVLTYWKKSPYIEEFTNFEAAADRIREILNS